MLSRPGSAATVATATATATVSRPGSAPPKRGGAIGGTGGSSDAGGDGGGGGGGGGGSRAKPAAPPVAELEPGTQAVFIGTIKKKVDPNYVDPHAAMRRTGSTPNLMSTRAARALTDEQLRLKNDEWVQTRHQRRGGWRVAW